MRKVAKERGYICIVLYSKKYIRIRYLRESESTDAERLRGKMWSPCYNIANTTNRLNL